MKLLKMYDTSINERFIDEIVATLRDGGLIIYPTDTIYAIGCDALNNRAIEKVCQLKGLNPDKQTLSVIASDISMASDYARIDNKAFSILRANLPGPFTFILPASTRLPKVFKGRKSVGIRIPDNRIACEIVNQLGNPILSTTIMPDDSGEYPVYPQSIALEYKDKVNIVIDGGEGGEIPSTVVDLSDSSDPVIVREGKGDFQS